MIKLQFDAQAAIEDLKKDVRTNAEKRILDMIGMTLDGAGWIDASKYERMRKNLRGQRVLVVLRSGEVTTEDSGWLKTDANGHLFRSYEKDRVLYFMPYPDAPDVPEAVGDEDVYVEPEKAQEA